MLFPLILERALRTYLRWDPETLARVATFAGKVVKIELTDWNYGLYCCLQADGISVKKNYAGPVHATITGSSWSLLRMGIAVANDKTPSNEVVISGDVELAHAISQIIKNSQIDWEEPLSYITGDVLAHQLGKMARHFKRGRAQTFNQVQQNITEYLQEELRLLPSPQEIEDFYSDIYKLYEDVERIEAHIAQFSVQ